MPNSLAARITRMVISPRLAISKRRMGRVMLKGSARPGSQTFLRTAKAYTDERAAAESEPGSQTQHPSQLAGVGSGQEGVTRISGAQVWCELAADLVAQAQAGVDGGDAVG